MPDADESEYPLMPHNHEEFDARVLLHATNAVSRGLYKTVFFTRLPLMHTQNVWR